MLVESLSYASSPTPTDRGDSFMNPPWCRVWCYGRYATGWKMFSGNVVLDLISTCFIPRCSPVLTQTKPAAQHYKHVERAPSQLTHSLLILHSTSQHEQSPCCYETNFLSWNLQKNAVCGPTASHVDHRLDMKPVVQAVCMPSKVSTNETKCPFDSKPQIKQQIHMWVSQLAVRGSRWGVNWSEISATVLVSCQGAEVMSAGHCSLFWRVKSEWGLKVGG